MEEVHEADIHESVAIAVTYIERALEDIYRYDSHSIWELNNALIWLRPWVDKPIDG